MAKLSTSPYHALKMYVVVFIKDAIDIDNDAQGKFMKYVDSVGEKFENSFTGSTPQNTPKFIANGEHNRWIMADPTDDGSFLVGTTLRSSCNQ